MGRSTRAPGVHLLPAGGHAADMRRYELVSDDGVVLHTGWTALAGLLEPEEGDAIMWHLRDLLNDRLQAHTCPECRRPTRTRRLA